MPGVGRLERCTTVAVLLIILCTRSCNGGERLPDECGIDQGCRRCSAFAGMKSREPPDVAMHGENRFRLLAAQGVAFPRLTPCPSANARLRVEIIFHSTHAHAGGNTFCVPVPSGYGIVSGAQCLKLCLRFGTGKTSSKFYIPPPSLDHYDGCQKVSDVSVSPCMCVSASQNCIIFGLMFHHQNKFVPTRKIFARNVLSSRQP
ncbi:methylcrotonoyl-CoA carboxylase [Anopheles sinensis]|uniref:Methylcrotonoyl-CoA carboxylase n=1 Tax=Anopheles sinensis TaxID=74873 RepID=A0A084VXF4_ANOSI|nr:methylcrotonoyl-CoA carboxylase [Anopheles sinensis]